MPRKRKANLAQESRKAKARRRALFIETPSQSQARRKKDAAQTASRRTNESSEETQARRKKDAAQTASLRANESSEETQSRLRTNSQRAATHRATRRAVNLSKKQRLGMENIDDETSVSRHYCGTLQGICEFCNAKHFPGEMTSDGKFSRCCSKGIVQLGHIRTSSLIESLMTSQHEHSNNFMLNIRSINSSLAFASMGAQIDPPTGNGPYCFRINGSVYHRAGALHPPNEERRRYAQLYILDPDEAAEQRLQMRENQRCNGELLRTLSSFMTENNPFAEACKMLYEVEQEQGTSLNNTFSPEVSMAIIQDRKNDQRRYNTPRSNEVAIIFVNADGEPPLERDLLIHCRSDATRKTERINILDPNLEPLVYPLLFPFGEQSWGIDIPLQSRPMSLARLRYQTTNPRSRVTQMQYYQHRLSIRDFFNPFLSAGKLTQQYIVDAYVKMEGNRLNYIRRNQSQLRVENYKGLMDHIHNSQDDCIPGKAIILPSSFQGSPRNMIQNYQDAMAIVRTYGKPDLFVTMTCNPKWQEITDNLNGQSVENRPDLVARVFHLKLKEMMDDITNRHIFGVTVAKVHVIEFQKRGLPHAHILLILKEDDKPTVPEKIDQIVSAELPDKQHLPVLHSIVAKHMVHGPCGQSNPKSPCMKKGECTKAFPKSFQTETIANICGYSLYRRRNCAPITTETGKTIDNSWVVPYNPYLLLKFNCHINVEVCASVKSIKYIFKYIYKGHDCANVRITEKNSHHDEVKTHVDSRYVSAPEAMWRILAYDMHHQSHTIVRLPVHLPAEQNITFNLADFNNDRNTLAQNAQRDTMLTAWFKLNQVDDNARTILYSNIPRYYVFNRRQRRWIPRKLGGAKVIGRLYSVNLGSDPERYCLRLLLLHLSGAQSFTELRTIDRTIHSTFKEAAQQKGLIKNEEIWEKTLEEASVCSMPRQMRDLFAHILIFASPPNAEQLLQQYKSSLWEDFAYRHGVGHTEDCIYCLNLMLQDINNTLIANNSSCDRYHLPKPPNNIPQNAENYFEIAVEHQHADELISTLNEEQRSAFDTIISAMLNDDLPHKCFFLDGPGGTGKTYLYKTLLSTVRGTGDTALAVASTGIAANLLNGGKTYFNLFKLVPPLNETSTSNIRIDSAEAEIIRLAKIIIWDEATMGPYTALRAVDRLLEEIMNNQKPFGGKLVLLGGDFRQTLPVVRRGSRSKIVESSIKYDQLWDNFHILSLKTNVRSVDLTFSEWLLGVGNGDHQLTIENVPDLIEIPKIICYDGDIAKKIFGEELRIAHCKDYAKKAILCPKNSDVDIFNERILGLLEGNRTTYLSSDSIEADGEQNDEQYYPIEFLNEQTPSGMPLHILNLKVGSIVMLLRNLNTQRGMCNGTRLIVKNLKPNLIMAEVITGSASGQQVFIPRIDLAPTDTELPFTLRRRQFPIKLAFAMTINKSQGQTMDNVGIYLPEPVFTHGQLYVALSRVRRFADIIVKVVDGPEQGRLYPGSEQIFTKNVVFEEIL